MYLHQMKSAVLLEIYLANLCKYGISSCLKKINEHTKLLLNLTLSCDLGYEKLCLPADMTASHPVKARHR